MNVTLISLIVKKKKSYHSMPWIYEILSGAPGLKNGIVLWVGGGDHINDKHKYIIGLEAILYKIYSLPTSPTRNKYFSKMQLLNSFLL